MCLALGALGLEVEKLVRIVIFLEGVEELGLRDGHRARERYLHEMVSYDRTE